MACRPHRSTVELRFFPEGSCGYVASLVNLCGHAASFLQCCAGNNRAVLARLHSGVQTTKVVSFWLYNMLSQPLSSDQLLLQKTAATQLSSVVNSSRYDLRFATPDSLRSSEVQGSSISPPSARKFRIGRKLLKTSMKNLRSLVSMMPNSTVPSWDPAHDRALTSAQAWEKNTASKVMYRMLYYPPVHRVWWAHVGVCVAGDGGWTAGQSSADCEQLPGVHVVGACGGCDPLARVLSRPGYYP